MEPKPTTADVIARVSQDLKPVQGLRPIWQGMALWIFLCAVVTVVANGLMGYDPEVWQMLMSPGFLVKQGLLLIASLGAVAGAMQLSIPGVECLWARRIALVAASLWLVFLLTTLGLDLLQTDKSLASRLELFCVKWIFLTAIPLVVFLIQRVRSGFPIHRGWAGFLTLTAAGTYSAFALQFHCFGDPLHSLLWHLLPVYVLGGGGIWLGRKIFRLN